MITFLGGVTPEQAAVAARICDIGTLEQTVDAVQAFVVSGGQAVYVECDGARFRWSPATRGSYPLVRVLARFLGCAHHELIVGFVTVDGWCIVADPDEPRAKAHVIIDDVPDWSDETRRWLLSRITVLLS